MDPDDLEEALDQLYRAEPSAFIALRDRLATTLRTKDRDLANEVKRLRRPTQAAWAINQLHFDERDLLDAIVVAGHSLRSVIAKGEGPESQEAARMQRAAGVARACAAGLERIESAKMVTAGATEARLTRSLEAIAAHGGELPDPAPGRMDADLEPPGFELLAGLSLPTRRPRRPARARRKAERHPRRTAPAEVAPSSPPTKPRPEAVARLETATRALEQADAAVELADSEMDAAAASLTSLREQLEGASRRVAAARRGLDAARRKQEKLRADVAKLSKS